MEETSLFSDQRLGPNDFTNKVPRIFPTADLGGLIKDVRRNKFLDSVIMPRQWNNQENVNTWGTHQGKIQGGGGGYARKWGFSRQRPKAKTFRPLFNTGKKGNTKFTREVVSGAKPRTPPSSARQIYDKVPAKIFHTLFRKVIVRRKQDNDIFVKIWGKLTW